MKKKFQSAKQLNIRPSDLTALKKVLRMLERGTLVHVAPGQPCSKPRSVNKQFNMAMWFSRNDCGTVCCIGGTAQLLGARDLSGRQTPPGLDRLFFPPCNAQDVTVKQAAKATRNYLTSGEPKWDAVLRH